MTISTKKQQQEENILSQTLEDVLTAINQTVEEHKVAFQPQEMGTVAFVGPGVARVTGLPGVRSEELVSFAGGQVGMTFNIDPDDLGVILLGDSRQLRSGMAVRRTGRVLDIPVGEGFIGRVINALGRPLDDGEPINADDRWPVERPAPSIMERSPVTEPLQTGVKVVDALFPIGRGQRELIVGDRQTGKTAIALDTIINQHDKDVICIYCAIGQRASAVAKLIADLENHDALKYSIIVVAAGEDAPGLQYLAPYAATTLGEYFMEQGRAVLIVYDDLTRHARAYRELSLLLRRPPGREAYPGDIFYIHSRLLERSTHLRENGGSLTALPIVETQAQNLSAYIPTNLISITDGQLYLSPDLYQRGILPAVNIGRSVSRVGGKAQLPAYREVAGDLRLSYSQFEELEAFSRFGTRLEERTRRAIERGQRVREVLKQMQYQPWPVVEQIAVMLAVTEGVFDDLSLEEVRKAEGLIREAVQDRHQDISEGILASESLSDDDREALLQTAREVVSSHVNGEDQADEGQGT